MPNLHFSIDDVFPSLLHASQSKGGLFDNEFFRFLRQIHEDYKVDIDLYLFYSCCLDGEKYDLTNISDRFLPTFQSCPWIRFAPHAIDPNTPPFAQSVEQVTEFCLSTYRQIERIAGEGRTSSWVRFHFFSECYEIAPFLRARHVDTLLTTDKPAFCYRLPDVNRDQLQESGVTTFNGIHFRRSHIRIESLFDRTDGDLDGHLRDLCGSSVCPIVFTHEYELKRQEIREFTFRVLDCCTKKIE